MLRTTLGTLAVRLFMCFSALRPAGVGLLKLPLGSWRLALLLSVVNFDPSVLGRPLD